MATESIVSLRGFAKSALALLLFSLCLCEGASGQATSPSVVPSVVTGLTAPGTWATIWQTAISSHGDFLVMDFQAGLIYQYPADGGPVITLTPPPGGGGWADGGIAIDKYNNMYLNSNWNWDETAWVVPYDPVNKTWNMAAAQEIGDVPGAPDYQNEGLAINSNGLLVLGGEDCCAGLWTANVDATGLHATNGQTILSSVSGQIHSLAVDNAGNIYMFEPGDSSGILMIPAGTTGLPNASSLQRVDPTDGVGGTHFLTYITGATVDADGNLYVGDGNLGVFMVPNENGTLNPADWVQITSLPATAQISIDSTRKILYVPTSASFAAPSPFVGVTDVAKVYLDNFNLGSAAVGSSGTAVPVVYSFSSDTTPARFVIQEAGAATPDFTILNSGTCVAGTTYTAQSSCTLNVAVTPQSAGSVSAQLLMQTGTLVNKVMVYTTVSSANLQGTGIAAAASYTPAMESTVGANLKTPSQVATDAVGNIYVADAGLKQVLMYPAGADAATAPVSVGTGLSAPTGVAVDGNGDVFIADSGNLIEVPYVMGALNVSGQVTLKTGLSPNVHIAVDGLGNLYAADPGNGRIIELISPGDTNLGVFSQVESDLSGFTAPSSVAVDASNNLYVADGANLIEVAAGGTQTTLLNNLSNVMGLAVDASGSVYVSSTGGTVRIPNESGTLNQADETTIAATVTDPTGVAVDKSGNVYLADGTAEDLHLVSINGALNLGSPALGSTGTADATLLNIGNSPLTVTDFVSSNTDDLVSMSAFSATGCGSAVSVDATCTMAVTMDPGPGEQGLLSSVISIQGNAANGAVVNASGTAAALAGSKSTITVGSNPGVLSVPITVTVAAATGSGTPTGTADVYVDGQNPTSVALTNGTGQVTLSPITGGPHTFSVEYVGDSTYGRSSASTTATVAFLTPVMAVPNIPAPGYVLSQQDGDIPYDQTAVPYETNYKVVLTGSGGLIPSGTLSFMEGSIAECGPNGAPNNSLPAGSFSLDVTGSATFQPGCLPINPNTLAPDIITPQNITSIVYSGDMYYAPLTVTKTANGGAITFNELRNPSVAIAANPSTVSVSGGTGSTTLSITSVLGYGGVSTNTSYPLVGSGDALNNYTLPLGFACQGLPAYATCTFTGGNYVDANGTLHPDEVNVNTDPSVPVTITATVTVNVPTGATTSQNSHSEPYEFAALLGFGIFGLAFGRKAGHKMSVLMMIVLLILTGALAGMTACSTTNLTPSSTATTPSGTYTVMVTAQQVGSVQITQGGSTVTLYGNENQMSIPFTMNVKVQ